MLAAISERLAVGVGLAFGDAHDLAIRAVHGDLKSLVVALAPPSTDTPLKRIQEPIAHFFQEPRRDIDTGGMYHDRLSRWPHLVWNDTPLSIVSGTDMLD